MTAIVWLRRDLRLTDNPALMAAVGAGGPVLAVYVHSPEEESPWSPGAASHWWLHHSLAALHADIAKLGGKLLLLRGPVIEALRTLAQQVGATSLHWNRRYEPAAIARDTAVKAALSQTGVTVHSHNSALWLEPWQLQTQGGQPYRVFSPFWRALTAKMRDIPAPLRAPVSLSAPESPPEGVALASLNLLPRIPWDGGFYKTWTPGEQGAAAKLQRFIDDAAADYSQARDIPSVDGTSSLSPHLHFGEISPRQILAAMQLATPQGQTAQEGPHAHYLRELGWREFSHHLLFHYPHTAETPMDAKFAAFAWRKPDDYAADLAAWQRGQTGIPIVDAGMRQLWATGWMHNRVRMMVASLLTKNLLIPWQEGARWFWDTLVDADLAQNSLGWQWSAGSGADAAPYFRIFNPVLQGEKFDPKGVYTRQWVPELAKVPDKFIHKPWEAPVELRRHCGISGTVYSLPRVHLAQTRERALAAYGAIKGA